MRFNLGGGAVGSVLGGIVAGPAGAVVGALGGGTSKGQKALGNLDPTKVRKADTSQTQGVAEKMGAQADKFFGTNVPLHQVGPIGAKSWQAATVDQGQGFRELQGNVRTAEGNIDSAGVMDPQIAAYLRAAQQQGQYSPQAFNLMQQAAMGQGPSAAQAQLQSGVDQALKAQMAAAGSRGFSAAAMRGAQMQGAEMQQQAVSQAAILRAQEQQAAQQAFLQAALDQENMARTAALQAGATTLQADVAGKQAKQAAINAALEGSGQMATIGQQRANLQAQLTQDARSQNAQLALEGQIAKEQALLDALRLQQAGQLGYAQLGSSLLSGQLGGFQGISAQEQQRLNTIAAARSGLTGGAISAAGVAGAAAIRGGA